MSNETKAIIFAICAVIFAAIIMLFANSCIDETQAGGTCWHYNEKTCGVSGDKEVVLWCNEQTWKIWTYCQEDEICTTMNPYPGNQTPMAHCEDGDY